MVYLFFPSTFFWTSPVIAPAVSLSSSKSPEKRQNIHRFGEIILFSWLREADKNTLKWKSDWQSLPPHLHNPIESKQSQKLHRIEQASVSAFLQRNDKNTSNEKKKRFCVVSQLFSSTFTYATKHILTKHTNSLKIKSGINHTLKNENPENLFHKIVISNYNMLARMEYAFLFVCSIVVLLASSKSCRFYFRFECVLSHHLSSQRQKIHCWKSIIDLIALQHKTIQFILFSTIQRRLNLFRLCVGYVLD